MPQIKEILIVPHVLHDMGYTATPHLRGHRDHYGRAGSVPAPEPHHDHAVRCHAERAYPENASVDAGVA
jgi:hypothetical protein